jgi:hypothetical protein
MTKLFDILTVIILLPVVLIGAALCFSYWIVYFPIWWIRRELRGLNKEILRAEREADK